MAVIFSLICIAHTPSSSHSAATTTSSADDGTSGVTAGGGAPAAPTFSVSLRRSVLRCMRAFLTTCAAESSDFILNVTVIRADPCGGCQCVYQQFLPSRTHAISPASTSSLQLLARGNEEEKGEEKDKNDSFPGMFWRMRSWARVEEGVDAGLRTAVVVPPSSSSSLQPDGGSSSRPCREGWKCLAGALLMASAIINKQSAAHVNNNRQTLSEHRRQKGEEQEEDREQDMERVLKEEEEEGLSLSSGSSSSGDHGTLYSYCIAVFSEGENEEKQDVAATSSSSTSGSSSSSRISFSTECALAVAAREFIKWSKKRRHTVTLSCFGEAFVPPDPLSELPAEGPRGGPGAQRLAALARTLGGVCEQKFALHHFGRFLSPYSCHRVSGTKRQRQGGSPEGSGASSSSWLRRVLGKRGGATEEAPTSGGGGDAVEEGRGRGIGMSLEERLTSEYTFPAVGAPLGEWPPPPPAAAAYTAWLCPRCMCPVQRREGDAGPEETGRSNNAGRQEVAVTALTAAAPPRCPFCCGGPQIPPPASASSLTCGAVAAS